MEHRTHHSRCWLMLALLLVAAPAAWADTATATFEVSIQIQPSCSVSAADLDFGVTTTLASAADAAASISVTCSLTTPYVVRLDAGLTPATPGDTTTRRMSDGTDFVAYELYRDAARSQPWGQNGVLGAPAGGDDVASGTGTAAAQSLTVYGRVPAQATPAPATYTDTITATVEF